MFDAIRRPGLAVLLAGLLATAGCLGLGDDGPETNDTVNETNETEPTGDEREPARWNRENRSGSVPASSAVVAEEGANESFAVNGSRLFVNLSAEGGELEMCIRQPSGNDSEESSCDETVTTEDGDASFEAPDPPEGEWSARLTVAEANGSEVEYDLTIAQRIQPDGEAAGEPANASTRAP